MLRGLGGGSMITLNTQAPEKSADILHDGSLEVFKIWKTIQGEGPFAGSPAVFVRLAGCNLRCPDCDTDYTSSRTTMTPSEILNEAARLQNWSKRLIVLTGGEPFRQGIGKFILEANLRNYHVQVETNGTLYRDDLPWHGGLSIVCSPKTPTLHAKLIPHIRAYKYILDADHVAEDGLPLASMGALVGIARPKHADAEIYVQPLDVQDAAENRRHVEAAVNSCLQFGYKLSYQIHKAIGVE